MEIASESTCLAILEVPDLRGKKKKKKKKAKEETLLKSRKAWLKLMHVIKTNKEEKSVFVLIKYGASALIYH